MSYVRLMGLIHLAAILLYSWVGEMTSGILHSVSLPNVYNQYVTKMAAR